MNTYGDTGNIICLQRRCLWRSIAVNVVNVEIGENIPKQADLYFIGGGQDSAQSRVAHDLQRHTERLQQDTAAGIPSLSICGGYQLFGRGYQPFDGDLLPGISLFAAQTFASKQRMIGNVVIQLSNSLANLTPNQVVGFENHSGKTYLDATATPFGKVLRGFGNNGEDKNEGCIRQNAIGCYLHGSVLPKNPQLADWLIEKALGEPLQPLDDSLELQTQRHLIQLA